MGGEQREQPLLGKEGIRPALVVRAAASAPASVTTAQKAAQSHADPRVQDLEREATTVLKILKPASHGTIHIGDDRLQALSLRAPGFTPNRVFELPQTLPARPTGAVREVIAQKVKTLPLGGVHDSRFGGMQAQSRLGRPGLHLCQRRTGFSLAATQDHEIVGVPDHLEASLSQAVIQRIEIDIGQQRTDDGLNAKDNVGRVGASAAAAVRGAGGLFRLDRARHSLCGWNAGS